MTPGSVLFGAYEVVSELQSGGMGSVYRARHLSLGESRAIKVMRPEIEADPRGTELFLREARALLEVTHDAVSRCHDLLRDELGRLYLITEFVEGPSLRELLVERRLSAPEALRLCERVASGLESVHARGVIHRDVSPENLLLPLADPQLAKIIDFGVARIQDTASTALRFKGKLAYASPEQLGLFGGEIDARSDLYSLGLVLAEALCGTPICPDRSILKAIHRRQQPIAIPRSIPAPLRELLERLLMPDPNDRIQNARELLAAVPNVRHRLRSRVRAPWTSGLVVLGVVGAAGAGLAWLPEGSVDGLLGRLELGDPRSVGPAVPTPPVAPADAVVSSDPGAAASGATVRDSDRPGSRSQSRTADPPLRTPAVPPDVDAALASAPPTDSCTPEQSRTRASSLYRSGRACEAVQVLEECCPKTERRCRDMLVVLRARCRQR